MVATQSPILTLTMNPALDVASTTERVEPEHKLRCGPTKLSPGGGGVNATRTINALGGWSVGVYPLGGPTGHAYRELLEAEGIAGQVVRIGGSTRECVTIVETSTGEEYRFVLQGPPLREPEWRACLSTVGDSLPVGGYLIASGSLPPGVPDDFYAQVSRICREHEVRCVVDASGPALEAALDEGVFLIKPSLRELGELVGHEGELAPDQQVAAAQELVTSARSEAVALTLGGRGAVLVTADAVVRLPAPQITVHSAVGAGDAFLAAMVLRLAQGVPIERAFRTALAAGSATAMRPPAELCRAEDVVRLEAELDAALA
ncbi:1-phosphofructokinase family hexose kinase [Agromyces intestinalis]|uniref:1-phosphofructokinase family hexose kinase n=1 Tax=Agromyces intestinalis TaxID=2592652 RepID=A0A5C1YGU3_9MICO|nr:1-phosphofructokinase family hexose kinase [Agromyces intestinalis]QEO14257.1 1-phosphofructokinase family hexose kinase [Agromyces intestinalis]